MTKKSDAAKLLGSLGGKMRAFNLSKPELSAIAKKGGKARAKKLSAEELSAIARKAVAARIAKYKQTRHEKE